MADRELNRRQLLTAAGTAGLSASLHLGSRQPLLRANEPKTSTAGQAEHCIMIWLGGGAGQIDTWDPKRRGDPVKREPGSYYEAIPTAIDGEQICQHLSRCAPRLDRFSLLRAVHHNVIDEHAAAVNRMHTGRPSDGTLTYPSIGSIVAHHFRTDAQDVPSYVVMGYPNLTRGPGFLGARYGYLYLTDTEAGPAALQRAATVTDDRLRRRQQLLDKLRRGYLDKRDAEAVVQDYDMTIARSQKLAGPQFMNLFDLKRESDQTRNAYGGEFGQRCLLARRLVQSGVRFVEVSHNLNFVNGTGWDVHNEGIQNQYMLIEELDKALSALVDDLETQRLLDKTLIVVSTEFGRPAAFDGRGGRGHWSKAFSIALAGGGLKHGQAIGQTDELAQEIIEGGVSVPDLFATIFASLGIEADSLLLAGDRPVPITDMGKPIGRLLVQRERVHLMDFSRHCASVVLAGESD